MKFILNTTIAPHFCALFDSDNSLKEFFSWENARQDGAMIFEFFEKNISADSLICFVGGVSGPGGFSSLRVASGVLTACAIKYKLPIHSIAAEKWLSNVSDKKLLMPSFGKNVWLVENEKKSLISLEEIADFSEFDTRFLQEKQQRKITDSSLPRYKFEAADANFLLDLLEKTTPQENFVPAYSVPPVS